MKKYAGFLGVAALLTVAVASASVDEYTEEEIAFAKICVHEAGWHDNHRDCAAIHQVLRWRTRVLFKQGLLHTMHKYSDHVFNENRTGHRAFIAHLTGTLEKPEKWPSHLNWETKYKHRWKRALASSRRISKRKPRVCKNVPRHWGNRQDLDERGWWPKIQRGEWAITDCGDTKNYFLHRVKK